MSLQRLLPKKAEAQKLSARSYFARAAGLGASELSRKLGRGEGSVIGGRVTLALDPNALATLGRGRSVVLVSGTNGKTTTTSMVSAALGTMGEVSTNSAGANMFGGMVHAMSASKAVATVLETDEAHLPKTVEATKPRVIVLLNLSRDQLDRVGEVRTEAVKWRNCLTGADGVTVVANGDDPMIVWAAQVASKVVWVSGGSGWRLDAASCPSCARKVIWDGDDWACSGCDLKRPSIDVDLDDDRVLIAGQTIPLRLSLPGIINRRNAAMALAAANVFGADLIGAAKAIGELTGVGGRFASVEISKVPSRLLLAKNPAGWTESLTLTKGSNEPLVVAINARIQDGQDPSWLWDVPFEQMKGRFVVATGERGRDLAVRLHYADVDHVFEPDSRKAVLRAAQELTDNSRLDVVANYSAFQDFRRLVDK